MFLFWHKAYQMMAKLWNEGQFVIRRFNFEVQLMQNRKR